MRFSSFMANKYRKNGYVFVAYDLNGKYYDLIIQHPDGKATWIDTFTNRGTAIKEAKLVAMTKKLGFNPDTDLL